MPPAERSRCAAVGEARRDLTPRESWRGLRVAPARHGVRAAVAEPDMAPARPDAQRLGPTKTHLNGGPLPRHSVSVGAMDGGYPFRGHAARGLSPGPGREDDQEGVRRAAPNPAARPATGKEAHAGWKRQVPQKVKMLIDGLIRRFGELSRWRRCRTRPPRTCSRWCRSPNPAKSQRRWPRQRPHSRLGKGRRSRRGPGCSSSFQELIRGNMDRLAASLTAETRQDGIGG